MKKYGFSDSCRRGSHGTEDRSNDECRHVGGGRLKQLLDNWLQGLQLILSLVCILWIVAFLNYISGHALSHYGIYPREPLGLLGIGPWVLLHASWTHLAVNTTPLLFMGFFVALRGPALYLKITFTVWLLAGLAVWLLARPALHLGSSGLVFGYFGFLLAVAIYERSIMDLAVASIIIFYYGGLFFGILPGQAMVSFESHLFGFFAGVLAARLYGKDWVRRQMR